MKTNLKSGNLLTRFLLAHGEKVGIAAILACAGMLVWSSLGRDRLGPDRQPKQLADSADRALKEVNNFTWARLPDEEKPIAKAPGRAMKPVKPGDYPPPKYAWNPSIVTVTGPRTDPLLLPPTDLEAWSDAGLWAIGDRETADRKRFEAIQEAEKKRKKLESERERAKKGNQKNRPGNNALFGGGGGEGAMFRGPQQLAKTRKNGQKKEDVAVLRPQAGVKLTGVEEVIETSWVTVVAQIPIKQQYQLYDDSLRNSRGYIQARDAWKKKCGVGRPIRRK